MALSGRVAVTGGWCEACHKYILGSYLDTRGRGSKREAYRIQWLAR